MHEVHSIPGVCFCVQEVAVCQSELAQPSITEKRRAVLKEKVRGCENIIQQWKQTLAEYKSDLARAELGSNGKPR